MSFIFVIDPDKVVVTPHDNGARYVGTLPVYFDHGLLCHKVNHDAEWHGTKNPPPIQDAVIEVRWELQITGGVRRRLGIYVQGCASATVVPHWARVTAPTLTEARALGEAILAGTIAPTSDHEAPQVVALRPAVDPTALEQALQLRIDRVRRKLEILAVAEQQIDELVTT